MYRFGDLTKDYFFFLDKTHSVSFFLVIRTQARTLRFGGFTKYFHFLV